VGAAESKKSPNKRLQRTVGFAARTVKRKSGRGASMQCLTPDECEQWRDEHSRRREWKRQMTCETPLEHLPWYTARLVEQLLPFDQALLIIDKVVFDFPPELEDMRRAVGETRPVHQAPGHLFQDDSEGFRAALEAALSEWIDLRALFSPAKNALWADHDEYTTFFSESSGKVAEVRRVLSEGGVKIAEYTAKAP
jgi:hypothetical protein